MGRCPGTVPGARAPGTGHFFLVPGARARARAPRSARCALFALTDAGSAMCGTKTHHVVLSKSSKNGGCSSVSRSKALSGPRNLTYSHGGRCTACSSSSTPRTAAHPLMGDDSDHDCFIVSGTVLGMLRSVHCGNSFQSCAWIWFHSSQNRNSSLGRPC